MPAPEEKPGDWIYNAVPRSKRDAVARGAEARVTETVKSAIAEYLGRFLSSDGVHRDLLNLTAGFSVQFDTRMHGSSDPGDPSVYDIQLARFWGELRQKLPCILVLESGFSYIPSGLGGITDSYFVNRNTSSVQTAMLATLTIELSIAAMDETTCSDIRDLLVYILGPLSHVAKGHVIHSNRLEDKWEVRLPLKFEATGLQHKNIQGDTKDQLWTTSITIPVVFEGLIRVAFANQTHPDMVIAESDYDNRIPLGFKTSTGQILPISLSPSIDTSITVPSQVTLTSSTPIEAYWLPPHSYFASTDPRIALIDPVTCAIIPKKLGKFTVTLFQNIPGADSGPKAVKSWDVKVVPS